MLGRAVRWLFVVLAAAGVACSGDGSGGARRDQAVRDRVPAPAAPAASTTATASTGTSPAVRAPTTAAVPRPTTTAAPMPTAPPTTRTPVPRPGTRVIGDPAEGPEWTLLAVGDVLMDDTEAAGRDPFPGVSPALASGDLAVVNVEMAITAGGVPQDKAYVFRARPSAAATLAAAGVDVANLANNHSLDFGVDGLLDTVDHLSASGVSVAGAGAHATEAWAPASFVVKGVRVAVLGVTRVVPRRTWAAGAGPGVASAYEERRLAAAVRDARAQAEVVVVAVHWGTELSPCPDPEQVRLAGVLAEAGASVVLGSHPHVLQPVVRRGGALVAYSLGNFVFHRREGPQGDTAVLELRFTGAELVELVAHPHALDRGPPVPAGPEAASRVQAALANSGCGV